MLRPNPLGQRPVVHESAFVDATAVLCGNVHVGANVFIGPYAVIRADETDDNGQVQPIVIGANTNIQDGVVIHSKSGAPVTIGSFSSIAHRAIVHGPCVVGDRVFIGFNSVVFDTEIGDHCFIEHSAAVIGASLDEGLHVSSLQSIDADTDLSTIPKVSEEQRDFATDVAETNVAFSSDYRRLLDNQTDE